MRAKSVELCDLPDYVQLDMHPRRVSLVVLLLAFLIEAGIMLTCSEPLTNRLGPWGVALADSLALTVLLFPCLWWVIVRPLQRISECRQLLLHWALTGEERKAGEISRDLHDGIGQIAAAINVGLRTLEESSTEPAVVEQARHLRHVGRQLHEAVRVLARGLRPRLLDDLGLAAAVTTYAAEMETQFPTTVIVNQSGFELRRLPETVETSIYRIIQEAVTNAIRHGRAQSVEITLANGSQTFELTILDDGQGFDPEEVFHRPVEQKPFGLISIRERACLLGGEARISSSPGQGTHIHVRIPLSGGNLVV